MNDKFNLGILRENELEVTNEKEISNYPLYDVLLENLEISFEEGIILVKADEVVFFYNPYTEDDKEFLEKVEEKYIKKRKSFFTKKEIKYVKKGWVRFKKRNKFELMSNDLTIIQRG